MLFKATLIFSLAASALALPLTEKRAGVLTERPYTEFQISEGTTGGDGLSLVAAKFPVDRSNLKDIDAADVKILKDARKTAENAEVGPGGFNDALKTAKGDDLAALKVGKTLNKLLKLDLEILNLQIDAAQNGKDTTAKIAEEQKKLDNNIAADKKNAGAKSKGVTPTG